jgi:hypothetical protein
VTGHTPDETGDCRSDDGVIVGLIDAVISQSRIIAAYLRAGAITTDVSEALADLRADEDVAIVSGAATRPCTNQHNRKDHR